MALAINLSDALQDKGFSKIFHSVKENTEKLLFFTMFVVAASSWDGAKQWGNRLKKKNTLKVTPR